MRAGRVGAVVVACAGLPGCGALLSLDVHYVDAGSEDAGLDAEAPDAGAGNLDAAGDMAVPPLDDAAPRADGADADAGAHVGAPPVFVQTQANQENSGDTQVTTAFDSPVTVHDTLVVALDYTNAQSIEITDTRGNPFVQVVAPVVNGGTSCEIWAAFDIAGGDDTVTVTTGTAANAEVYIHEYSGILGVDVTASSSQAAKVPLNTPMTSGMATTTVPNDLVFGFGISGAVSKGRGFTQRSAFNANLTEDRIAPMPGPAEATATDTSTGGWTMLMAAFQPL